MSLELPIDSLWTFLLATIRLLALMLTGPLFSQPAIPVRFSVGLACAIAWIGMNQWPAVPPPPDFGALEVGIAASREMLIGISLGFAVGLAFSGFALLGEFTSIQGGLGAATVLDPTSGAYYVVVSSLLQLVGLAAFLAIDGHHSMLRAIALSFQEFPIGAGFPSAVHLGQVAAMGSIIFEVAVRLAAPVTAAMLISNVAVGMLGRAIPQLNLMALQLPAHVGVTLLLLGLGAAPLTQAMADTLRSVTQQAVSAVLGGG